MIPTITSAMVVGDVDWVVWLVDKAGTSHPSFVRNSPDTFNAPERVERRRIHG